MDDKTPQMKQTFQSEDTMLSNKNMYDGIVDEPLAYIDWSIDAAKPNSSDWTSLAYLDEMIAAYSIVAAEPMLGDLVFYHDGKEYVRIKANGKVFLGEGVASDEASRLFWEQVEAVGMRLDSPESEENNVDSTSSPALDQVVNFMTQQSQDEQQLHNDNYERAMKVIK